MDDCDCSIESKKSVNDVGAAPAGGAEAGALELAAAVGADVVSELEAPLVLMAGGWGVAAFAARWTI